MNEIKKLFESRLQDYLKCRLDIPKEASILKKNIKYKWTEENKVDGFVGFDYIQKANGYTVIMSFESTDFSDFLSEVSPPYRSNLLSKAHFTVLSINFSRQKLFGNTSGTLYLPNNEQDIDKALELFCSDLNGFILPLSNNFYCLNEKLIDDVIKYADFYSHPTLLVIFLAKKHGMRLEDINNPDIFNKRLSKNIAFTKTVAEKMLK
jgi:uncharacterized protein YqgQ